MTDLGTFGGIWGFLLGSCFKLPSWTTTGSCPPSNSFSCDVVNSWEYMRYSVSGRRQVCWTAPHAGLLSPGLLHRCWWVGVAPPGRMTMSAQRPGVVFSWAGRVEDLPRYSLLSDLDVYGRSKYWGPEDGLTGPGGEPAERHEGGKWTKDGVGVEKMSEKLFVKFKQKCWGRKTKKKSLVERKHDSLI